MELIVISETKLKIMLSPPDMVHYELEGSSLNCVDDRTRAAFRHIFEDARDEIGFDTEGERLFIQLYASRGGGCEIFVTKLGEKSKISGDKEDQPTGEIAAFPTAVTLGDLSDAERELLKKIYAEQEEEKAMPLTGYSTSCGIRTVILRFEESKDLTAVCKRLLEVGYKGASSAYIEVWEKGDRWYLLLEMEDFGICRLPVRMSFLSEYGEEVNGVHIGAFLREYGRCICGENAVEILGVL